MPSPDPKTDPRFTKHRWKPGQSGNPKGRPKKKTLEEVIKDLLADEIAASGKQRIDALAAVILEQAITQKNPFAIKLLAERLWPVPKQLDVVARRADEADESEVFPTASIDSLSDEKRAELQRLAHEAIMGSAEPIDADYRQIEEGESDGDTE